MRRQAEGRSDAEIADVLAAADAEIASGGPNHGLLVIFYVTFDHLLTIF